MCMDHTLTCKCGRNSAGLNFRDELMPPEVIEGLYCPTCSEQVSYSSETMMRDNGWIIAFDMDVARFIGKKIPSAAAITPSFLFDEGYCTWRGVYPSDHIDSRKEKEELLQLSKIDKKKYLEEFRTWGIRRMERLAREGWRKADAGVN